MKVPSGFLFAGGHAGIRVKRRDVALVVSEVPAAAAGCLTQSRTRAAPVAWCAARLPTAEARAIVTNTGSANSLTGAEGDAANERMARAVAVALGVPVDAVLTASTGVIGVPLPVAKIEAAVPALVDALGPEPEPFAEAILTTDTCTKVSSREVFLGGARAKLLGVAKGSGMVHPNLATTLAYVLTDAAIDPAALEALLREAVDDTFNLVSVDRDTSTNDAVFALANGLAGNARITDPASEAGRRVATALREVCRDLARAVAADGEGAQHLLTARVTGAAERAHARALARAVVESSLVKAAFFGTDPNWGRIAAALGQRAAELDVPLDPAALSIAIQNVPVLARGAAVPFDADALRALLRGEEVFVDVSVGAGGHAAEAWGCDLSYDYVRINADYGAVLVDPAGPVRRDQALDGKTPELKAITLLHALRYIERFRGKRAVVHCSGAVLERPELADRFAEDVRLLHAVGLVPILALADRPADALVADLARAGGRAVAISGRDGNLLRVRDGVLSAVDAELLELLLGRGYVPVLSLAGVDGALEAAAVSAEVAIATAAEKLIFLADAPGLLSREGLLVSELSAEDLDARGGELPRELPSAQSVLRALEGGVASVHLIDGRVPHNIVAELFTTRGVGTMVRAGAPAALPDPRVAPSAAPPAPEEG